MDETHKVAITRLGDRIRVGGMAELDGYSTKLRQARRATLEHVVTDLYPKGGDVAQGQLLVRPAADDPRRAAGDRPASATPISTSTPATARWAGPWPAAPAGCWPT